MGKSCFKSHQLGHFGYRYQTKNVREEPAAEDQQELPDSFLLDSVSSGEDAWSVDVGIWDSKFIIGNVWYIFQCL